MKTEQLIVDLARDARPVRPLRRPWRRTAAWAAAGIAYLAVLIALMPVRGDLALRMQDPRFIVEQVAALLTGVTAAAAAFATSVPGHRRAILWAPFVALAVWLGAVVIGVAQDAARAPGEVVFQADWGCVATILIGAAVPAAVMASMIRRGAPVSPRLTAALAALAAAGLGNVGICIFHPHSSNLVILLWHCGTVLLIAAMAGALGASLLRWPSDGVVSMRG
jgi:hypothetical protein